MYCFFYKLQNLNIVLFLSFYDLFYDFITFDILAKISIFYISESIVEIRVSQSI